MRKTFTAIALVLLAFQASANLQVEFREGAPKDRFILSNVGSCTLTDLTVTIDLKGSKGKLIFDVTEKGAGVEVFQPFAVESGPALLPRTPNVVDGQTEVTLDLPLLAAGNTLVVSTDLDDTLGAREITVSGSEFSGTLVNVLVDGISTDAVFGDKPAAMIKLNGC